MVKQLDQFCMSNGVLNNNHLKKLSHQMPFFSFLELKIWKMKKKFAFPKTLRSEQ